MSPEKKVGILRIVVASPSDVQEERDALPGVLEYLNRGIAADRDLRLELFRWETDAYPGFHPQGPQGAIDEALKIEGCDVLIGIFWKKFGTPVPDAQSGTEHEFRLAYKTWQEKGKPQIMVYFNQKKYTAESVEETNQLARVLEFRQNFSDKGLWWKYKKRSDFENLVRNHLTNFLKDKYSLPGMVTPASPQRSPKRPVKEEPQSQRDIGAVTDTSEEHQRTKKVLLSLKDRINKLMPGASEIDRLEALTALLGEGTRESIDKPIRAAG